MRARNRRKSQEQCAYRARWQETRYISLQQRHSVTKWSTTRPIRMAVGGWRMADGADQTRQLHVGCDLWWLRPHPGRNASTPDRSSRGNPTSLEPPTRDAYSRTRVWRGSCQLSEAMTTSLDQEASAATCSGNATAHASKMSEPPATQLPIACPTHRRLTHPPVAGIADSRLQCDTARTAAPSTMSDAKIPGGGHEERSDRGTTAREGMNAQQAPEQERAHGSQSIKGSGSGDGDGDGI